MGSKSILLGTIYYQRTLAAKSLEESQKGIVFAAFLKLIIPLIVVIPGIVAYVFSQPEGTNTIPGVVDLPKQVVDLITIKPILG